MAVHVEETGILQLAEVDVLGLLILVAGVTEEHEVAVVLPLWKVEVL